MKFLTLLAFSLSLFILPAQAQPKTATAPGSHFSTSGGRVFWMGANYRKEWNTPVTVPVLDLSGMKFLKRGGGKQTKSLHLEDASGRRYKIRTIQKFITDKTLPGDLNSEAAADLVSDGVSASYPYASLSMQPLADAVGVPYGKVKLVYIPDDPALGEYQKDFGNILATYEEKMPDSVKKDYDTDEVAEKLEKDNDNTVDEKALLTARILDMFVMDLDRHEGQWSWGAWKNENGGKTYFPIPKDRDQAFYINQGFLPGIAKRKAFVPQLEGFKAKAHDIDRFNYAARNLDRFFLTRLSQADWQKAVDDFIPKMTDQVIENALAQQPPEIRALPHNQQIIDILKERRKYLAAEVMEYYKFISEIVTITGSDKNELF
nr:metallophosphoesterase [Chitinophagaceae bacterium]